MRFTRVAKAQPWAGIGERFQRYSFADKSSQEWVAFRLFVQNRSWLRGGQTSLLSKRRVEESFVKGMRQNGPL